MPEWYKKRILQRPGQETQSVTERPSETYQLELSDFRIPTVTNSEDSIMTGLENRKARDVYRKARDAYNQAYNEYLEQHPISHLSGVGYNPYIGIQYNPQVKQQQAAHDYAVKESGYIGDKSTSPYKNVDDAFGAVSAIGVSMIPLLGASYGTFGVLPRLAADTYFGYEGTRDLVSPEGVAKTVNFAKQGRGGRAILSGIGDLFDLTLARQGLKGIKTLGAFAKETPYVAKFNWMNRKGSFRMEYPWQRTPETLPERLTLEHIAEDQTPKYNSNQITGHFGKVKYYGPTMGKTTAVAANSRLVDFDDIIRQPSRTILDRYGFRNKSEMYNSGNQEAIKAYEDMLVKTLRDWRANPENSNLTLVASPTAIANPSNTGFYFDNVPSIPSRDVFITRNVGRGGTPEASALWYDSLMQKNPNLKIDDRFVSQIESKPYQSPSASQLEMIPQMAYASNIQKQAYQRPQTSLTPLKEVFGDSTNISDMVDFYKGSKPMLFGDMREIISDPNFAYFQGRPSIQYNRPNGGIGKFYINQDRLKQTIGAYKDLYASRLNLPNTATVDDIYNHIVSNPAKIDPALNEAENIQDVLGLSLGYGVKDAMLFKDPYLLDLDGTYKETVPGIFDILSKRMNLKQLKREPGTLNGNHITWKFRTGALDDWKTKDKPKINLLSLNEDLPRESTPMWKRIGSIIKKAQSDLDAMNSYHIQNVEEWNKLNGKNFKPITFRTDIGTSKILSKKDFINWIKQRKTNGPSDDVERVGAMYSPYEDMVYLRDDGISSGAYHEFLHQGQYGMRNPQVTLWRIGQLVDPKKIESLNPRQAAYYLSEQELPVHLRQMGENANINVGDPYPGDAEFDELLTKYPIFGSALFLKRDTPEEKRLFWRALNGTLFGLTGVSLIPQKQE